MRKQSNFGAAAWMWLAALALLCQAAPQLGQAREPKLDLTAWQQMPVFDGGRVMPLDTFARSAAETICNRVNPELTLEGYYSKKQLASDEFAGARKLFPGDDERRFTAAELLLSWIVAPEQWEHVPFLIAEHDDLRKLLKVPVTSPKGTHLRYVAPAQVADSEAFQDRLTQLMEKQRAAQRTGQSLRLTSFEQNFKDLADAYARFRELTFRPLEHELMRSRFKGNWEMAKVTWQKLAAGLMRSKASTGGEALKLASQVNDALAEVAGVADSGYFSIADAEPAIIKLRTSTRELSAALDRLYSAERARRSPRDRSQSELVQPAALARTLADNSARLHYALYDNGDALRIVPSLDPAALRADRDTSDEAPPWLTLQTVLYGSPEVLRGYPSTLVRQVREAFGNIRQVYVDREGAHRARSLPATLARFAERVRALGEQITVSRQHLEIPKRDQQLVEHTAYPAAEAVSDELAYNRIDPFKWSWMISLAAVISLSLSFGVIRKPMFWLGLAILAVSLAWMIFGFYLRVRITGWAPVTGMYETVIYVPLFVSLLGAWFTLLPVVWPGLKAAWRLSAIPGTWEAASEGEPQAPAADRWPNTIGWLVVPVRLGLMAFVAWLLAFAPYAAGERTIVNLLPVVDVGASMPDTNNLIVWLVGMCVFLPTVWLLPRAIVTSLLSLVTVPRSLVAEGRPLIEEVYSRWPFALSAMFVAFAGSFIAWYSPVLERGFSPLQPVLRDNFWLTIHVLTIVSSYGAGALAWGLGNIALAYYLFGRYRPAVATARAVEIDAPIGGDLAGGRRPPEACAALAGYVYKAMQVAVLLLAAGTILGGLWADVSWGRFWGWDPKEVWALVSLMTYLVILHGRYAGWIGNFGLAAGSVMGATSIIMSWYGVNFLLGVGLHAYGFGTGGQMEVGTAVLANWVFLGAAALRYWFETSASGEPAGLERPRTATAERAAVDV